MGEILDWLSLKMQKGATSQGMWTAFRRQKGQENVLPWGCQKEHSLASTLILVH